MGLNYWFCGFTLLMLWVFTIDVVYINFWCSDNTLLILWVSTIVVVGINYWCCSYTGWSWVFSLLKLRFPLLMLWVTTIAVVGNQFLFSGSLVLIFWVSTIDVDCVLYWAFGNHYWNVPLLIFRLSLLFIFSNIVYIFIYCFFFIIKGFR